MLLPTAKTPPKTLLSALTILLYAPSKFGKSTFASHFSQLGGDVLFLSTEPGLNHLETFQVPITSWEQLLAALGEIATGKHNFRTIVIDTVDNLFRLCVEYMNAKNGVAHESELGYGKGYQTINNEFHRVLTKLSMLGYGLVFISHAVDKEFEGRTGKYTRTIPTLPEKARQTVLALVDIIAFGDFEKVPNTEGKGHSYRRVLRTKAAANYEAGDRTRRLPETIEFNFAAFAAAFEKGGTGSPAPAAPTLVPPAVEPQPTKSEEPSEAPAKFQPATSAPSKTRTAQPAR